MAVVNAKLDWERRSSSSDKKTRSATRRWTVLTDSVDTGEVEVKQWHEVPRVGQTHPDDPWMLVSNVKANAIGPTYWEVLVSYKSPSGGGSLSQNPLDQPPDLDWESANTSEAIDVDANGKPIVNVNFESPEHPIEKDHADPVLVIKRNQASYTAQTAVTYSNSINSGNFYGEPPGRARMLPVTASQERFEDFVYWIVVYRIQFRKETSGLSAAQAWHKRVLNEGYTEVRFADGEIVQARDVDGQFVTSPILIDALGFKLDPGAAPIWLTFPIYPSVSFAPLALE